MKQSRREVLKGLATSLALVGSVGCAGKKGDSGETVDLEPGTWEPGGTEDFEAFPYGIQVGDATHDGAVLSVRTELAEVTIEVVEVRDAGWRQMYIASHSPKGRAVQVELDALVGDQLYTWVARTADGRRSLQGWFRTPPAPGDRRVVRFGAVSCLGGNRPWPCLSRAAEQDLDAFLFLGDTIYNDWGPAVPVQDKWDEALGQDGMVDLSSSTSFIATWDDHELRNNWNPEITDAADVREARAAFREAVPQRLGPDDKIWRSLRWGNAVEFFVLDCRSERRGGRYISTAQMDWLKGALSASPARFKIILNSVPITDLSYIPVYGTLEQDDRWQGFPSQRQELVAHCAQIPGVLFVSGDFHVGAAALIDPEGSPGEAIHEVLAGPGGSPIHEDYSLVPSGGRLPAIVTEHNYTLFECDPTSGRIDVSWIGNDGSVLDSLQIVP